MLTGSVSPQGTVILPPDDVLRITFSSDLAEEMDTILLYANNMSFPVWYNGARYVAELPCRLFEDADSAAVRVAARDTSGNKYSRALPVSLKVRPEHSFPLIETKGDFTPVSYSRGLVRLGGPYLNEFPEGVRFASNGKFGDVYRVKLNATEQAFIDGRYVRECPPGMPRPAYNITSMSIAPDTNADRVVIPWPEPVPYAVFPEPELQRIRIRLYGVRSNSTWISHRHGLKMIDHVSWEQKDAGTYDVLVYLKESNIWGYDLKQTKRSLVLGVKYPPEKQELVIALEAGHGGEWNWGAVGLSGLKEKDINLDVTEKLRDRLKEMGIQWWRSVPVTAAPICVNAGY
ncbi:MAG: N-acetylmuramoyl-L-alanine amidase [Candidatus Marinimicrobia bacterium]|nr:N-acetylmuramoyl-L-alanine amidase [Candidatus Neomarinimicrobiota bacterium]